MPEKITENTIVGYLGPEGSYSQLAAKSFRPQAKLREYVSFFALFAALSCGECDFIAVPIENSLNGGVLQNIDLMQSTENVIAVEECVIKIDHRLATLSGADLSGIKKIYSHPQALAQCSEYLAKNFPYAELIASPSTAASLKLVKDSTEAGIVGSHTSAEGFTLSTENIADQALNLTHFLLIKKGGLEKGTHSQKIFISATCRHRPGELINLLALIKEGGLNMTKIESRPIKDKPGEYRFFIELDGDIADENAIQVLKNVENAANSFKLLGAY